MENGAPYKVIQTVEGQLGAGHNSVFRGPDGAWWICCHAWDAAKTGRYLLGRPDRLGLPRVSGSATSPRGPVARVSRAAYTPGSREAR